MDEIINAMNVAQEAEKAVQAEQKRSDTIGHQLDAEVQRQKRAHATKYIYNRMHELCLVATGACLPLVYMYVQQNDALMAVGTVIGGYSCWILNKAFRRRANGVKV